MSLRTSAPTRRVALPAALKLHTEYEGTRSKANHDGFYRLRGIRGASRTFVDFHLPLSSFLRTSAPTRRVGLPAALKLDTDYEYTRPKAGHDGFCLGSVCCAAFGAPSGRESHLRGLSVSFIIIS